MESSILILFDQVDQKLDIELCQEVYVVDERDNYHKDNYKHDHDPMLPVVQTERSLYLCNLGVYDVLACNDVV